VSTDVTLRCPSRHDGLPSALSLPPSPVTTATTIISRSFRGGVVAHEEKRKILAIHGGKRKVWLWLCTQTTASSESGPQPQPRWPSPSPSPSPSLARPRVRAHQKRLPSPAARLGGAGAGLPRYPPHTLRTFTPRTLVLHDSMPNDQINMDVCVRARA
jgi:hypothetical protein